MDSLDDQAIDRIFNRIESQIDLSKITTKKQFFKAIKDNPKTKKWNESLNDFFWDIQKEREKVIEDVPEIEMIPFEPIPTAKRKRTMQRKKETIDVKGSYKQKSYTRQKGRRWKDVEIKFAQRLKKDGLTHKQIATQLNRTPSSVSTKLNRVRSITT